jgi:hypothetical protein
MHLLLPRAANLFSTSGIVAGIRRVLNISVGIERRETDAAGKIFA